MIVMAYPLAVAVSRVLAKVLKMILQKCLIQVLVQAHKLRCQGIVTAIPGVLTTVTGGFDPVLLHIYIVKWVATSIHHDSVNRSTAISGFSQMLKNTFCEN